MSFFHSLLTGSSGKMLTLVVGDSNANGFSDTITSVTSGALFNFNGSTFDLITTESVSNGNPTKGSIYQKMADVIFADSGRVTHLVNAAAGGSSVCPAADDNDWSTTGTLYAAMQTKVNDAIIAAGGGYVGRIIINLLINDVRDQIADGTDPTIAAITTYWNSLLDRLHTDFPLAEILLINVGRTESASGLLVLSQCRDLVVSSAWDRSYCHMVNSGAFHISISGGYIADNLHYSTTTNDAMGNSIAKWERYSSFTKQARSIIAAHFDEIDLTARNRIQTMVNTLGSDLENIPVLTPLMSSDTRNYLIDFTFRTFNGAPTSGFVQAGNGWLDTNNSINNCFPCGFFSGWASAGGNSGTDFSFGAIVGDIRTAAGTAAALFGVSNASTRIQVGHGNLTSTVNYYANTTVVRNYSDQDLVANIPHLCGRLSGTEFYYKDTTQVDSVSQAHTADMNSAIYVGCLNNNGTLQFPLDCDIGFVYAIPSSVSKSLVIGAAKTYLGI